MYAILTKIHLTVSLAQVQLSPGNKKMPAGAKPAGISGLFPVRAGRPAPDQNDWL
jgi:hypothetical protein